MILNQGPRFEPLSEDALATLDEGVGRLASEVGVQFDHPACARPASARRARPSTDDVVRFDPAFLRAQAALAPSRVLDAGPGPGPRPSIGGDNMVFCPAQGPPFVRIDGERRDGTMADLEQLMRLTQMTDALDTPGRNILEPNDVPLDVAPPAAGAGGHPPDRPGVGRRAVVDVAAPTASASPRSSTAAARRSRSGPSSSPTSTSTRRCTTTCACSRACSPTPRRGRPVIVTPFLLMGAMAPVSRAGGARAADGRGARGRGARPARAARARRA